MARIKAQCPTCGDMILHQSELQLRVCVDNDRAEYLFRCPVCDMTVSKGCSDRIVDRLIDVGVPLTEWSLPAELFERPSGPPISHRDLVRFRLTLQDDEAWADAVRQLPQ